MNDRPTAEELLAAVREYLLTEVAPSAADHRSRFRALIAANVVAIVRRELGTYDAGVRTERELAEIASLVGEESGSRSAAGADGDAHADAGAQAGPRGALVEANRRLAQWIRDGAADSGEPARAARALVRSQVEGKLAVSNPGYLKSFADKGH